MTEVVGDGKTRILIVEDDFDTREVIADHLRAHGYEVDMAANGAIALEKALIRRPDVVLFDLAMPVTDGPTFVEELRGLVQPVPVLVAMSGLRGAREWCAMNGVPLFLRKPFGGSTLRRAAIDAVGIAAQTPSDPPPTRPSLHTACVVAVGTITESAAREQLPQSLQRVRIVVVEPGELAQLLDELVPYLLLVDDSDAHTRVRSLAVERGIPVLVRPSAPA
jgi:CheY-like chemotaxis protein